MPGAKFGSPYICTRCLRASQRSALESFPQPRRWFSSPRPSPQPADAENHERHGDVAPPDTNQAGEDAEKGAMSRRLEDMSEEALATGGRSARKAVEEAGFDSDLKRRLEERIAGANFKEQYVNAFAQVNLPASAGKGTRDIAGAQAWTGEESVEDASLRMLNDAHKPLRGTKPRLPSIRTPLKVDTGHTRARPSAGAKLANARDKTSIYSSLRDTQMGPEEREKLLKEMKERFQPHARAVPATIQGLASLANERIEDAIARGQFKNLPRGKKLERDYTASSPFLDTTEYFMNKIIQKQEIVPPWIEKQQELVSSATKFRSRLRSDWKRHAARVIASKGGSLENQMLRARMYAEAEKRFNPKLKEVEKVNTVDGEGQISQITLSGELKPATENNGSNGVASAAGEQTETVTITAEPVSATDAAAPISNGSPDPTAQVVISDNTARASPTTTTTTPAADHPFRDPNWEETEMPYLVASIKQLNSLTRSYNLMAPDLAKKPYFGVERELKAAFADVAPQLADAIRERALAPKARVGMGSIKPGESVMERFTLETKRKIYDEGREKRYGFREFLRDVFGGDVKY
ncbi:hypothetical protein K490DRAFT_63553 [Saccharata proteae CBS 121410]|uniref:DnaJ homologue subfamily C member 28 conserved domain-containing protein n=1 Tax=Saccharata proteae CBS 121410 TaxID=1314787 RepID=A0A6A5YC15_9PEZI|nr:hypothetical protein K490DRAFT_63553 [Saccharata proteae CBS 121410]